MIVADASATVDALLDPRSAAGLALLALPQLHAPELLGLETLRALRSLQRGGRLDPARADQAVARFAELRIARHAHRPYEGRVWRLRDAMTSYDAVYIALAEGLELPLLTTDLRLARAAGNLIEVVVPAP